MSKVFIMHQRFDENQKTRTTVAGTVEGTKLILAASRCSNRDQFCRKIGNNIATGRLKNPLVAVNIDNDTSIISQFVKSASKVINQIDEYLLHQSSKNEEENEKEVALDA